MRAIRRGDDGDAVVEIRCILAALGLAIETGAPTPFAPYDESTERAVRSFQQSRGLAATGEVDVATWRALDAARWRFGARILANQSPYPMFGDDVNALQGRLVALGYAVGHVDGVYGVLTAAAVTRFQHDVGLLADGACGPQTTAALRRAQFSLTTAPSTLPAAGERRCGPPVLADRRILVDPGHGVDDSATGRRRWNAAEITYDLAARLDGRLAATGMRVHLSRGPLVAATFSPIERAGLANELGVDLLVSLHLRPRAGSERSGIATFFGGRQRADARPADQSSAQLPTQSRALSPSEEFARIAQAEVIACTGLTDGGVHAGVDDLLCHADMPAIRMEVGSLDAQDERTHLINPLFRDRVAAAIVRAIHGWFQPPSDHRAAAIAATSSSHHPTA